MPALQAQTGTLYPDTVALRHIFGYSDYSLRSTFALDNTEFGPRIEGSLLADVLVVSVDIDTGSLESYRVLSDERQYSIGISVLDTRDIQRNIINSAQDQWSRHIIQSFQFTIGQGKYVGRARGRFLFGDTKTITFSELKPEFEAVVGARSYILVFHGVSEDMRVLRQLGIGQQARCILDTTKASQFPLQRSSKPSSEVMLETLGIHFDNLHAAGNDAHFVLKALLMLAVRDAQIQHVVPSKDVLSVLTALERIARAPTPAPAPKPLPKPPRVKRPKQPKKQDTARKRRRARRKLERETQALEQSATVSGGDL
ncbi:hypothetical protein LLEC1_01929 [Akanthomyces lecanii]|uniref:Gfd2/YDR514C-like C-terminal domain-containing protein n=1 Tax=Cordyceps confragosa TaxID=2714763 RepID=A0A179I823_CORDF|nr:hypothetical protein LLEC1_01929 [Akanthomyces lecanii]